VALTLKTRDSSQVRGRSDADVHEDAQSSEDCKIDDPVLKAQATQTLSHREGLELGLNVRRGQGDKRIGLCLDRFSRL
jgi:hypothetical protein